MDCFLIEKKKKKTAQQNVYIFMLFDAVCIVTSKF